MRNVLHSQILTAAARRPMTAYELAADIGASQAAVTRALAMLCDVGALHQVSGSRRYETTPEGASDAGTAFRGRRLFYSYSHRDRRYREELKAHLSPLRREGLISDWSDQEIDPGSEWDRAIARNLESADLILLLISPYFLASDFCYEREMSIAMRRHEEGDATVIPVIVRPSDWHSSPFAKLQALPSDAKPIVEWKQRDRAWAEVAMHIRRLLMG